MSRRTIRCVVTSGKDRGKQGRVLRVLATKGKAIVERVNFTKKHTRPNPDKNVKGGILEREAPIQVAKLQVICPSAASRPGSAASVSRTAAASASARTATRPSVERLRLPTWRRTRVKQGEQDARRATSRGAATGPSAPLPEGYVPRLKERYQEEVVPRLQNEFGIENPMAVPKIEKISLNMGMGEAIQNAKILDDAVEELATITGQKPASPRPRSRSPASSCAQGMPSARWSRCAANRCTSSSTV